MGAIAKQIDEACDRETLADSYVIPSERDRDWAERRPHMFRVTLRE